MSRDRTVRFGTPPHFSSRRLQDLQCSAADAPTVTPKRSNPHNAESATTSKLAPSRASGLVPWLQAAVLPRCLARPLSGGDRPLESRTTAFPRFRRLRPQQQTRRPGGLEGRTWLHPAFAARQGSRLLWSGFQSSGCRCPLYRRFGGFTVSSGHGGQVDWKAVPDPKLSSSLAVCAASRAACGHAWPIAGAISHLSIETAAGWASRSC
jgi:hypothetical protein